ncbi:MAG: NAD(P)H-dependent oxidoreductase subunit E [Bacteroidales bacterium]|nr:NAD(P)H-dependent oxidoreductase subunit E [Bacteroidales bacterium]
MEDKIKNILTEYRPSGREDLISVLQLIQGTFDYIPEEAINVLSQEFSLPPSKIYSIATFYNQFRFTSKGKYHIKVCNGTACHIYGSEEILREIEKQLAIKPGQKTNDGMFSLEAAPCIGACSLSPVVRINSAYYKNTTAGEIKEVLQLYRNNEEQ